MYNDITDIIARVVYLANVANALYKQAEEKSSEAWHKANEAETETNYNEAEIDKLIAEGEAIDKLAWKLEAILDAYRDLHNQLLEVENTTLYDSEISEVAEKYGLVL